MSNVSDQVVCCVRCSRTTALQRSLAAHFSHGSGGGGFGFTIAAFGFGTGAIALFVGCSSQACSPSRSRTRSNCRCTRNRCDPRAAASSWESDSAAELRLARGRDEWEIDWDSPADPTPMIDFAAAFTASSWVPWEFAAVSSIPAFGDKDGAPLTPPEHLADVLPFPPLR